MSPLELKSDSLCHLKPAVASSSGPGQCSDASRPEQACFARSVSHVSACGQPTLPSLRPADPGGSQLFFDKSSWPEYVEVVPRGETVDDLLSDFRLPPYDRSFDQYLGLAPAGREKLQGSGNLMFATSADRGVKRKNQFSEGNEPKYFLSIDQPVPHNVREQRRVAILKHGFEQLRSRIPWYYLTCPREKLNKFQILTLATCYIKELTDLLQQGERC